MDLDNVDAPREPLIYPDDESGSAYETDSANGSSSSHDERAVTARSSRPSSVKGRGRTTKRRANVYPEDGELSDMEEGQRAATSPAASVDEQAFEDAEEWAANFQAPESPSDIKYPPRREAGSRSRRRKRKAHKPANEIRAKRLKSYYNNDYRELLNIDIEDTAAGRIQEDKYLLTTGQYGSSIWTPAEKDSFFPALARLGRDNVCGIAAQIGSKSELQVQEYIQLLDHGIREKQRDNTHFLGLTDMPAAIQISDECSAVLERAGDALAIREERAEEKIEKSKWADSWLLTKDVSRELEKRRKAEGGEEEVDEVLPAVNFFNLNHWLQLSERVFMNPAAPHEEDNWQCFAESGETPAIRATAFEDFHSLAVNITKRLVSATLYCIMSKQRARNSKKVQHADVSPGDVEAAVNFLGMKTNSNKFWIGTARRCHLQVFNDDLEADEEDDEVEGEEDDYQNQLMTYDEVEAVLTSLKSPSRSRSTSRIPISRPASRSSTHSKPDPSSPSSLEENISSSDSSGPDYPDSAAEVSDSSFSSSSSTHFHFSTRRHEAKLKKKAARKAIENAQDAYTEAFDMQASQLEEARLWALLKQDPPFEAGKLEPLEGLVKEKGKRKRGDGNWREWVGFWSEWETMDTPVMDKEFESNKRIRRKVKMGWAESVSDDSRSGEDSSEDVSRGSQYEEEDTETEDLQPLTETIEAEDDVQQEDEDADSSSSVYSSLREYRDDRQISIKVE
jgi:RNA polymerase I-specific transcription initiation factor RRN5